MNEYIDDYKQGKQINIRQLPSETAQLREEWHSGLLDNMCSGQQLNDRWFQPNDHSIVLVQW